MNKIDNSTIEKIKNENPQKELFHTVLKFRNEKKKPDSVEFVFTKPMVEDIESFQKEIIDSAIDAQMNLITSIIVYPDPEIIRDKLYPLPNVVTTFIQKEVQPFFGQRVTAKTKSL